MVLNTNERKCFQRRRDCIFRKAFELQKRFGVQASLVIVLDGTYYVYRSDDTTNFPPSMKEIQTRLNPHNVLPCDLQTVRDAHVTWPDQGERSPCLVDALPDPTLKPPVLTVELRSPIPLSSVASRIIHPHSAHGTDYPPPAIAKDEICSSEALLSPVDDYSRQDILQSRPLSSSEQNVNELRAEFSVGRKSRTNSAHSIYKRVCNLSQSPGRIQKAQGHGRVSRGRILKVPSWRS
ncbi:MAG: hypothetical protein M1837_006402 [Sclerophora amabilis]|nr:MAG: hypothetical protein M1837_006402 [Sclerophora amabilis]